MPISPEAATANDFDSLGEFLVYSLFQPLYSDNDDVYIFCNVNYISATRSLHGNVDFIFLDKEIILFLEVKGKEIYYDSRTNRWYKSYERIKEADPFKQVSDYLYDFRDKKLKRHFHTEFLDQKLAMGYAVLLPETLKPMDFSKYSRNENPWTIEYDPEITADKNDCMNMASFKMFLDRVRKYWFAHPQNKRKNGIKDSEFERLSSYIRCDLKFEIPLPKYFEINEEETKFYTKKQSEAVIRIISSNLDIGFIVSGGPGTGKTLIARELLVHLTNKGKSVLFVCYNKSLADFLINDILNENPSILNNAKVIHYNGLLENNVNENRKWDYLIIDEGQDILHSEPICKLDSVLNGGFLGGRFMICLDKDNQNTYGVFDEDFFANFNASYTVFNLPLVENCRNTYGIIKTSKNYTGVPETDCMKKTMTSSKPEFWETLSDLTEKLNITIRELLEKGVKPRMITVLTMNSLIIEIARSNSIFTVWDRLTEFRFPDDKILVMIPEDFKGLENNIIIFTGSETYEPENQQSRATWHVAFTRARDKLILLLNSSLKEKLTKMYYKNNKTFLI